MRRLLPVGAVAAVSYPIEADTESGEEKHRARDRGENVDRRAIGLESPQIEEVYLLYCTCTHIHERSIQLREETT